MNIVEQTQRPNKQTLLALWQVRNSQRTVKIKPFSERPVLLGEVPQVNTIGVGQGGSRKKKSVRLAGGDLPVGQTSESDWYYPTTKAFSEGATTSGESGDVAEVRATQPTASVEDRDAERCGF